MGYLYRLSRAFPNEKTVRDSGLQSLRIGIVELGLSDAMSSPQSVAVIDDARLAAHPERVIEELLVQHTISLLVGLAVNELIVGSDFIILGYRCLNI